MLKIYITNLGKYNEGYLIGEWVTLPIANDELNKVLQRIGINKYYEEYFITDYESDIDGLKVNEYSNIDKLNEIAERLENLSDYELEIMETLISEGGYSFDDAMEKIEDAIIYYNCYDMTDVAMEYCEQCGVLDSIPEHLQNYFDFEAYGRDMSFEGEFHFTSKGNCIQVF